VPEEEKGRRLRILQERQKQIQLRRYERFVGTVQEALVEGRGNRENQWKGRTTQNIVLNFAVAEDRAAPVEPGDYWHARVTQAGPNSVVGEAVAGPIASARPREPAAGGGSPFLILQ